MATYPGTGINHISPGTRPWDATLNAVLDAIALASPKVGASDPGPSLPSGTEYVWFKTNGAGTLLDILTGVAP